MKWEEGWTLNSNIVDKLVTTEGNPVFTLNILTTVC